MSLGDLFAECPQCGGYIIEGTLRTNRKLSSMCRCPDEDEEQITDPEVTDLGNGWFRSEAA